ncbi:unnamed protein product [Rotaria sordida]|uniref:Uncharacterized protein n=2 Tax=Rotaria sordida TaxID=392033 RepID=A0A819GCA9_9BILA|nr:unnamed protein product [Rotaria sordida]
MSILYGFLNDLEAIRDSIDGFRAAWNGNLSVVKEFLNKYPRFKDKSGPWGTTLLYSAARNNHMPFVVYLVTEAHCSVNALNQQHIEKALLKETILADDYQVSTKAGSAALHAACFGGYLQIVKYLVELGANYFLRNQAEETPIINGEIHEHIIDYFQNLLNLGYTKQDHCLSVRPIVEGTNQPIKDCLWEYKTFSNLEWFLFNQDASKELNESLIDSSSQQFKQEIYIKESSTIYTISTIRFLRTGMSNDQYEEPAWIRCRGSSILNFDCYAIWQILLTKHPQSKSDTETSLEPIDLSIIDDQTSEIQLNVWYNCDAKTNDLLDKAMSNRRRQINLCVDSLANDELQFDLMKFSIQNKQNTISGFLRWIPKLVSNNEKNKHRITNIDNFQTLTNLEPAPLTTKRLREVSQVIHLNPVEQEPIDNSNDEDFELSNNVNRDHNCDAGDENNQQTDASFDIHSISLDAMTTNDNMPTLITTTNNTEHNAEINPDDYLNDSKTEVTTSQQSCPVEPIEPSVESEASQQKLTELNAKINNLRESHAIQLAKIQRQNSFLDEIEEKRRIDLDMAQKQLDELHLQQREKEKQWITTKTKIEQKYEKEKQEYEQNLNMALEQNTKLNEQIQRLQKKQETFKKMEGNIQVIPYNNIDIQIIQNFIIPKFESLERYLKESVQIMDEYFIDLIPKITFRKEHSTYTIIVRGFPNHQNAFQAALKRIIHLSNSNNLANKFYQDYLNQIKQAINQTLIRIKAKTHCWKQYVKNFIELLEEKMTEYINRFNISIRDKSNTLIEQSIFGILSNPPWIELRQHINQFLDENTFENEIEKIKHRALDEFIKQNISYQRLKLGQIPTEKSVNTIKYFIDQIRTIFMTNPKYKGHKEQHFNLIPSLLQQIMIYYSCFTVQLPLFESSKDLLDNIDKHTVTTITTSTGSGKSTLLPALLIAEGYDRVLITQPRRLPCVLISQRVNETIETDTADTQQKLAGFAVSGDKCNSYAKILYLTDGLLKERLLYDENFISVHTRVNKSIVFFIDEVHERSVNIDLCLALLARLLTIKPILKSKMKIIISSATLDQSVPILFQQIPNISFPKFNMPQNGYLHPIEKFPRPKENILDIVQELYKKRQRNDQILCFVSSVAEVHQCCSLIAELTNHTIKAYPITQSQSASDQQYYIEHGSVFFSTTIAETSLTFPSLKYVIDTGMVNIPIYNPESKRTVLEQVRAAESTIKQRLGRLGRTRPGEYYYLYDFRVEDKPYPTPHIKLSDLTNIEFSLRRSPIKNGLHYMQQFLPDKPESNAINTAIEELRTMGILELAPSNQFTAEGESLAKLPDFGSLVMSKAVLAALDKYQCGRDLIALASILSVLNTTALLKGLPQSMKSSDGDFMTLLNVMNEVLLVKQSVSSKQFALSNFCQKKGLRSIQHIIRQAWRRYTSLERAFNLSDEYRIKAQIQSGEWKRIALSLLAGYADNVFVSMKELNGRIHRFVRYTNAVEIAKLDLQSTLTRPISQAPVSLVLARDIRYTTAIRSVAIISFVGELKPSWVQYTLDRDIPANSEEKQQLRRKNIFSKIRSIISNIMNLFGDNRPIQLSGIAGTVFHDELLLRKGMISTMKFKLENKCQPDTADFENLSNNLKSVTKMIYIFQPMQWRWEAEKQVKILINNDPATNTCEITVEGQDSENQKVKKEFNSFVSWLKRCVIIRPPNAGVQPRLLRPKMRKAYPEIEEKISHITASERTMVDLYKGIKSTDATRETRMEVVAWIAICKFNCKLEGGFVRDWIVGNYRSRPINLLNNPKRWIEYRTNANGDNIPYINKEVVPSDLDCHLPLNIYFDIDKFQDELYKSDITCRVFREDWRYVVLIDEDAPTGPFTMDLIEPHVALTHDRIDFDVSNLSLEKDYPREIGMRIDITESPYFIELETIIENIKSKHFQVLRPIDKPVTDRIDRMIQRQWTQIGEPMDYIPRPHLKHAVLVPLPSSSTLYKALLQKMQTIGPSMKIISIEEIRNPLLEDTYESMKKVIARECPNHNPNEQKLFHGTKGDAIKGIVDDGYDDRFFSQGGAWGKCILARLPYP